MARWSLLRWAVRARPAGSPRHLASRPTTLCVAACAACAATATATVAVRSVATSAVLAGPQRVVPAVHLPRRAEPPGGGYHVTGGLGQAAKNLRGEQSTFSEPDASRGYDVDEYGSLWRALAKDRGWPSVQRFSAVGPIGEDFPQAVSKCVSEVLGWDPVKVSREPRTRWQAVRLEVRCMSPDDFCAIHSCLKRLDGVKSVL
mmetsp:Transcript_38915/g.82876  ORF Transcript_38915/g.82876 Transcript_38915/m.82876 type:complete len:202 (-) Transcript_38915:77-682(-)